MIKQRLYNIPSTFICHANKIFFYKIKKSCLYISHLFKIWILWFLELKNKLWTKIFSSAIASSSKLSLHLQSLSPQRSPSQQTCGTWDGSFDPHWDTNIRNLCLQYQYLQYPHRYCFDWKLENSGQTETDDSCEMKKNLSNLSTQNWVKQRDGKIFWWNLTDDRIITLLYISAPADPFEKDRTRLMIDAVSD